MKKCETIALIERSLAVESQRIKEVSVARVKSKGGAEQNFGPQLKQMPAQEAQALSVLLKSYSSLFAEKDTDSGCTDLVEMTLDTGDHPPIQQRLYRTPHSRRPIIKDHINDMLQANIIRPSTSPWSSPVVMLPKKDGSWRTLTTEKLMLLSVHKTCIHFLWPRTYSP